MVAGIIGGKARIALAQKQAAADGKKGATPPKTPKASKKKKKK